MWKYTKLFQEKYQYLKRKYEIIDNWLDRLRIKWSDCKIKHYFGYWSSTLWENAYWWNFLVSSWKASTGKTIQLIWSINYRWYTIPVALCRILDSERKQIWDPWKFLLDFYGITFQLEKLWLINIEEMLKEIFKEKTINWVSRIDFNVNFEMKERKNLDNYIIKNIQKHKSENLKTIHNIDTFGLGLYQKKTRNNKENENKKVKYQQTKHFWFRIYNKTKNIYDLWIAWIYTQYKDKEVLRLEGLIWSEACSDIYLDSNKWIVEQCKESAIRKIFWKIKLIESKNKKIDYNKDVLELQNMKRDLNSRIETYLLCGWSLNDLKSITQYSTVEENFDLFC